MRLLSCSSLLCHNTPHPIHIQKKNANGQTSYATISQLALAFLAAQAVAAPVAAVAGSGTELDARSPAPVKMCGRFQDQGFGCVRQCYGSNCADVPRSKPAKRDVEGRDGEVEKRTPVPVQMCGNMPDHRQKQARQARRRG